MDSSFDTGHIRAREPACRVLICLSDSTSKPDVDLNRGVGVLHGGGDYCPFCVRKNEWVSAIHGILCIKPGRHDVRMVAVFSYVTDRQD